MSEIDFEQIAECILESTMCDMYIDTAAMLQRNANW